MKVSICAPSYKRPRVRTLDSYPRVRVYVDEGELDDYLRENPEGSDIVGVPKGVQGNLCRIRNYILEAEYAGGADAVMLLDDDMESIVRYRAVPSDHGAFGYSPKKLGMDDLEAFAGSGTELCAEWGYRLWGVNCLLDNRAYRHNCPFSTTAYIGGPFSVHLKNPLRYDESLPLKEDYDMTLQHMNRYRGALRFNAYHYVCKQSEQVGGCASYRNMDEEQRQFEALRSKWGGRHRQEGQTEQEGL